VELTKEERARIADSKHKLQSIADSLTHVDPRKIQGLNEIEECLEAADESLNGALKSAAAAGEPKSEKKGPVR
jgi:hypothetical protein